MSDSFSEFERLEQTLSHSDPAEVHGLLCGLLCAEPGLAGEAWLSRLENELADGLTGEARNRLLELFAATVSRLDDPELSFYPLLPDDRMALSRRAEALGGWCQGFLAGLGLGGLQRGQALLPEVREFLEDLADIARVGFDTTHAAEEDEAAYMEIVEYVRIGVLLVSAALKSPPDGSWPVH